MRRNIETVYIYCYYIQIYSSLFQNVTSVIKLIFYALLKYVINAQATFVRSTYWILLEQFVISNLTLLQHSQVMCNLFIAFKFLSVSTP